MDGVLLIYKERNWTSRDVCNKLQSIFNTKSIGHLGTLDPFAEGLLAVTINKANKIMQFTDDFKKTYIATLCLGVETSTGDLTGEIINNAPVPTLNKEEIEKVLSSFLGKIKQVPPMTSAVHYQGRKLYEIAHEGEIVERTPREVKIYEISLLDFKDNQITFEATVSKGTYLRVLGEDIAKKLNTVGHLTSLLRTKVGHLELKDAIKISEVNKDSKLIPIVDVLTHYRKIIVDEEKEKKIKDGMTLPFENMEDEYILIVNKDDQAIAIYRKRNKNMYHCFRGLW